MLLQDREAPVAKPSKAANVSSWQFARGHKTTGKWKFTSVGLI
jgi:hypothetical protein